MSRMIQVVDEQGDLHVVPVDAVLSKREGNVIVVDRDVAYPRDRIYVFPGLHEYRESTKTWTSVWLDYVGKDHPKLFPKYEVVESAPDYLIVRRRGGQLFKFTYFLAGEVVENIYLNAGESFWDLVALECVIEAKENPSFQRERYRLAFVRKVVEVIGFLTQVCDLVEMKHA
ncbi:MAG: hypothetical protein QXX81_05360 [Zestosphaera sp.]